MLTQIKIRYRNRSSLIAMLLKIESQDQKNSMWIQKQSMDEFLPNFLGKHFTWSSLWGTLNNPITQDKHWQSIKMMMSHTFGHHLFLCCISFLPYSVLPSFHMLMPFLLSWISWINNVDLKGRIIVKEHGFNLSTKGWLGWCAVEKYLITLWISEMY